MIKQAKIIIIRNFVSILLFIAIIMGAIFCHVRMIKELIHLRPSIISGSQK